MMFKYFRAFLMGISLIASVSGCRELSLHALDRSIQISDTVDFGPTLVGTQTQQGIKLINTTRVRVSIQSVAPLGTFPEEMHADLPQGLMLLPGETKILPVTFQPNKAGPFAGELEIITDQGESYVTELTGLGVDAAALPDQSIINFGNVPLLMKAGRELTLSNPGSVPVQVAIPAPSGRDADQFQLTAVTVSVPAGGSHRLPITFTPTRLGLAEAQISYQACPTCPSTTVQLQGNGIASALSADPVSLDFGSVQVGTSVSLSVDLVNLGSQAVSFNGAEIVGDSTGAFRVDAAPGTLNGGSKITAQVTFSPRALVEHNGTLRFNTNDSRSPRVDVPLKGLGGGPQIVCTPSDRLDYGLVVLGTTKTMSVTCRNIGQEIPNSTAGALELKRAYVAGDAEFHVAFPQAQRIYAGQEYRLDVEYYPQDTADDVGTLKIETNIPGLQWIEVQLLGKALPAAPCVYELAPARLDFGVAPVGGKARLAFGVRNQGQDLCAVQSLGLSSSSSPDFKLPKGPISYATLRPGEKLDVQVEYAPTAPGAVEGAVEFYVNSSSGLKLVVVPLTASAAELCLQVRPSPVDFGQVGLACSSLSRQVVVTNTCNQAVSLQSALLEAGSTPEFAFTSVQSSMDLAPGQAVTLTASYDPVDIGADLANVQIRSSDQSLPQLLSLVGEGWNEAKQTDVFDRDEEANTPKVDVLFVVDNSGSMAEEQYAVATNFAAFLNKAIANGIDYHIGVTTTGIEPSTGGWSTCPGGVNGGEAGRLFPVDGSSPRIITPQTPNPTGVFATNIKVGTCHWNEQGIDAAYLALSQPLLSGSNAGFIRSDARLAVVFVSDEEDFSLRSPESLVQQLISLKGGNRDMVTASAIVGLNPLCPYTNSVSSRYPMVVSSLGGTLQDICTKDWSAALDKIAEVTVAGRKSFTLSRKPVPSTIYVTVDGAEVPEFKTDGTRNWTYDPAKNAVIFTEQVDRSKTVTISYDVSCG